MLNLNKLQDYQRRTKPDGSSHETLVHETYAVNVKAGAGPDLWLANGNVYDASGQPTDIRPPWLNTEINKLTGEIRRRIGFEQPAVEPTYMDEEPLHKEPTVQRGRRLKKTQVAESGDQRDDNVS